MANIVFARTDDPNSKAIKDGQLVFDTSGNGKMYLDNGTERLEMGGSMSVDSVLNAESTNPIQNKAVAGVMLKTLDEVGAVTKAGFIPDALTVKQLNSNLTATDNTKFRFATDGEGNYGYLKADDSFVPFKSADVGILKDFTAMTDVGGMYYISKSCVITDSNVYLYFASTAYDGNFGLGAYSTPLYDFTEYSKLHITGIISCTTNYVMFPEIGYGSSVSVGTGAGDALVLTDGDKQVYESKNEIQIIDKEFDISSVSGNHLIAFGCYARGAQYCNTKMLITSIILS